MTKYSRIFAFFSALWLFAAVHACADEVRVAVASNFIGPLKTIANDFYASTGKQVTLIVGSTGKHYAQIKNGAPFDAFFAADAERPKRLEKEGIAIPGSRFTYAMGTLVLWSPKNEYIDSHGHILLQENFRYLAIANPRLAPYGKAAQEVLVKRGLWQRLRHKIVRGANIGQTYQFVKTGNAELGFVAASQIMQPGHGPTGSSWKVPQNLYSPIKQQAVLLQNKATAQTFLTYVRGKESLKIIHAYGYGVSHAK